ncbi:VOC family protein [Tardibacter chloracetimidivorans]|nr:VOC family protein [Tardibacter chloracetimidivorans]
MSIEDDALTARLAMEPLGPIRQLGFVVRDLNQAIRAWTDIGVGPFYVAESPEISDQLYFGKPTASRVRGAWSYAGKMQIELLELMNDGPSLLRDFALKQGQGLQHMAYWVETFDDVLAQLQKQGYVVGQTGSPLGEHSRFAYVFQPSRPDSIVEISEYLGTKRALYEAIEMHSQNWDGRDPIRTWSPLS